MTGEGIFKHLISLRDHSGSPEDEYANDLEFFHYQAMLHHEEKEFFDLVLQAHNEEKRIIHIWDCRILIDGYPPGSLTLVPAKRSKGEELYDKLCKVDEIESPENYYSCNLQLLRYFASVENNDEKFFALIEKAESLGKKLALPDRFDFWSDSFPVSEIILVDHWPKYLLSSD